MSDPKHRPWREYHRTADDAAAGRSRQPTQQIRLAVEDFLDGRGTGDLLLVYLSCHGRLDAGRRLYFAAMPITSPRP